MGKQKLVLLILTGVMVAAVIFSINRMIKAYEKDYTPEIIITPKVERSQARPASAGITVREKKNKPLPPGYKKHTEPISSVDEKGNFLQ
jgi:hypothetical protein